MLVLRVAAATGLAALGLAAAAGQTDARATATVYRLRADLRLCPSPACGGFWVARVNQATTRCSDGTIRAWCYVADLSLDRLGPTARSRVRSATSDGRLLVRAVIVQRQTSAFGPLGRLVVDRAWLPATSSGWSGPVLLVSDTGVRCIRAPCFSLRAATVNTATTIAASGLDLESAGAPDAVVQRARTELAEDGLLVAGKLRREPDGGRTVVVAQIFLRER